MREIIEHIIKLGGLGYGPEQLLPRFKPQYREISPRHLLMSYIMVLKYSGDASIVINIPENLKIVTDSEYFYLIIQSLIFNLFRYSVPPANVEISYHDDAERYNYFTIKNSRLVISPEIIPSLFKPFYVGDESKLREKYGFIGLSLPVAKKMAESLRGDIKVTSHAESGTEFTLLLPKYQETG
jgi:signal transduction histidine kinase